MAWTLAGDSIPAPHNKSFRRNAVSVTNRTLSGGFKRDYVGDEKKVLDCEYEFIEKTDLDTIVSHYEDQRDNGTSKTLTINEDGLTFSAPVLIDINPATFPVSNLYSWQGVKVTFTEV